MGIYRSAVATQQQPRNVSWNETKMQREIEDGSESELCAKDLKAKAETIWADLKKSAVWDCPQKKEKLSLNIFLDASTTNRYLFIVENEYLTIVELPGFKKQAKDLLDEDAFERLTFTLASCPEVGNLIKGSNGLRKLRFAIGHKGKSGGVRIIYYYYNASMPLWLIDIYAKNKQENINQAQLKEFSKLVDILKNSGGKNG